MGVYSRYRCIHVHIILMYSRCCRWDISYAWNHFICNLVQILVLVQIFAGIPLLPPSPHRSPQIPSITRCTPCSHAHEYVRICTMLSATSASGKNDSRGHKKYLRSDQRDDYQKLPVISLGFTPHSLHHTSPYPCPSPSGMPDGRVVYEIMRTNSPCNGGSAQLT